jgi:three-Cys-motif partner protein
MNKKRFGGKWTIEKLNMLSDYLNAYTEALKNQPFKKIYIDAFAGTGEIITADGTESITGSARLALNAKNKFDYYIFIEKDTNKAQELKDIIEVEYPQFKNIIEIRIDDCNIVLKEICENTDWKNNRALLFLDPYATEVPWSTLEIISKTKAIDLWYLFPICAVQRMLPKSNVPIESWKSKLNMLFGDKSWEKEFYKENPQLNIFGTTDLVKGVNTDDVKEYILKRLKTVFPAVANNPRLLYNNKNSPLFLFCFAVSNDSDKAKGLALKIANHILNKELK